MIFFSTKTKSKEPAQYKRPSRLGWLFALVTVFLGVMSVIAVNKSLIGLSVVFFFFFGVAFVLTILRLFAEGTSE